MKTNLHLNLLKSSERLSSSPIRLRVIMPIAATLACVAMLLWWMAITGSVMVAQSNLSTIENNINDYQGAYKNSLDKQAEIDELEAELEQLGYYRAARRTWGETLTSLCEVMPLKVQLLKLEIPPAKPQALTQAKGPPLWGPTDPVEPVSMIMSLKSPKEVPVMTLMESLEGESFTNQLVIAKDPENPSPKVNSFKQDAGERGGKRMLAFEIEYRAKERRFE